MEEAARYLLSGLSYGMLLFLIASGLSLVLGVMGVLNLAHGSLYMIGAYAGLSLSQRFASSWGVSLLAAAAAAALTGLVIERLLLRRLHGRHNDQVLLTLGLVYVLGDLALWTWGSYPLLGRPPDFLSGSIPMGKFAFPVYRLALILLGLAVAAALWWFQERTRAGAIVRAGMDDREMTVALGVNYGLVSTGVFLLGAALAGAAGYVGAPLLGAKWDMGFPVLLSAMIVVVVGGVGRVEGALAGAILIGMLDNLGKTFFPEFALFSTYLVFIAVLLIRPTGLFGRATLAASAGTPAPDLSPAPPAAKSGARNWRLLLICAAAGLLLVVMPQFASAYFRSMLTEMLIFGLFALSLNILFGYAGLFSLGHAAFFGLGAYITGILSVQYSIDNFWVVLPAVILGVTLLAAPVALVALRTRGVYFIFVTLAIGELVAAVALKMSNLTGGSNGLYGIPYPDPLFVPLTSESYYYLVLALCALCAVILSRIAHSSFGLALQGIRDDERRMQHLGYNTWLFRFVAFVVGAIGAGIAGALYAPFSGTVIPAYAGSLTSTLVMLMVILGGARSFYGPVVGAALVVALQYYASLYFPDRWNLILGLVFVLAVLWLRGGILVAGSRVLAMTVSRNGSHERT